MLVTFFNIIHAIVFAKITLMEPHHHVFLAIQTVINAMDQQAVIVHSVKLGSIFKQVPVF